MLYFFILSLWHDIRKGHSIAAVCLCAIHARWAEGLFCIFQCKMSFRNRPKMGNKTASVFRISDQFWGHSHTELNLGLKGAFQVYRPPYKPIGVRKGGEINKIYTMNNRRIRNCLNSSFLLFNSEINTFKPTLN